ncbi:BT_3987 domain-containing protein [Sphingobacterium spiritivorum]|uniref:BT_3987 domain-containing protein n=1 Tax=Sphingobacterium spiritivorum TaxID=258 RepID=UPI0036CBDCA4
MKLNINILLLALSLSCTVLLTACKKELDNSSELFLYVPSGSLSYNTLNGGSVLAYRDKTLEFSYTGFPAVLTRALDKAVQVKANIDPGLVESYNKTNNTNYPVLPEGAFSLGEKSQITIAAGQTVSADSIRVQLSDLSKLRLGTTNYLIPVVLTSVNKDIPVSTNRQTMYVQVTVKSIAYYITGISDKNRVDIVLKRNGNTTSGTSTVDIKAKINAVFTKPVTVSVAANNGLVEDYNKKNNMTYLPFPAGSYNIIKDNVIIPANALVSSENIEVKLTDMSLFADDKEYLLPLMIKDNPSKDLPPADTSQNVVYLQVSIAVNNIDAANPPITGSLINRTTWKLTAADSFFGSVSNIQDGNNATSYINSLETPINLDMEQIQTVKGFIIIPNYTFTPMIDIISMEVFSSNDGVNWKPQGTYEGTQTDLQSSADNPDLKYVRFITPVRARYFKIIPTQSTSGFYYGLAEWNAIQ